jgi:hypothetical protein
MKSLSCFNKPVTNSDNKQSGIVFLEYVIMAFIITVAVICAVWWFYWHLQQLVWEIKSKLNSLSALTCPLEINPLTEAPATPGTQPPVTT